ncbi:MAG TPA: LysM peptidoglycan-binding domain-containing protein, partial [Phycicoccus sp.]|nr:LysM peptidoglycan-binding domain-containing protein [Phycicoccus sp.]
ESRVIRMQTSSNDIKRMFSAAALAGLVPAGAAATALWLAAVAVDCARAWASGVPLSAAAALTGVAACVAAAGLAWLVLGAVLEVLARLPGAVGRAAAALSAAVSPRVVRRGAAVLLGVGMGAGASVGPAAAVPDRAPVVASLGVLSATATPQPPDPAWAPLPDPGWVPEAPRVRPQPDVAAVSTLGRRTAAAESAEVVVRRGDSLWTIAARHLGPGAADGEVAVEWPRWYAANRAVIGEDPDLLLPGQVLRVPGPEEPR